LFRARYCSSSSGGTEVFFQEWDVVDPNGEERPESLRRSSGCEEVGNCEGYV